MVSELPQPLAQLGVASRDRPALGGGDRLHRVEAEGGHVGVPARADGLIVGSSPQRVGRILDYHHAGRRAPPGSRATGAGRPAKWTGTTTFVPSVAAPRDCRGADVPRLGLDVGEARRRPEVGAAVGAGGKGDRTGEQLVAGPYAGGERRRVKGRRARGEGNRVWDLAGVSQRLLERLDFGALGQPVAAQDLNDCLDVALVKGLATVRDRHGPERLDNPRIPQPPDRPPYHEAPLAPSPDIKGKVGSGHGGNRLVRQRLHPARPCRARACIGSRLQPR